MKGLTQEELIEALPPSLGKAVNPMLVMGINNLICADEEELDTYKDNLINYTYVLQKGKFTLQQYLNAVRYVGFRVAGFNQKESYMRTFPDKYADFRRRKVAAKDIASYITAYNKSKLVYLLFEQTMIPVHILNASAFQKALNVQIELMTDERQSGMVRTAAASAVMKETKPPEVKPTEAVLAVDAEDKVEMYKNALGFAADKMLELMQAGANVKEVTNISLLPPKQAEEVIDV